GHPIAVAVGVVAQERSSAHDPFVSGVGAARIGLRGMLVVVASEPVGAPFPHVAHGVEQAQPVGGEVSGRCGAEEPVIEGVRAWEFSLPDIAVPLPVDEQPIAPWIAATLEPTASGELPFGLARQPCA